MSIHIRKIAGEMRDRRPTRGFVIEIEVGPFQIDLCFTKARRK